MSTLALSTPILARIRQVLLSILDDGRVTDGQGRTVNFRNCIVILTSNVGAEEILSGRGEEGLREEVGFFATLPKP